MLPIEYDEQVEIECAIISDARRSAILATGYEEGIAKGMVPKMTMEQSK